MHWMAHTQWLSQDVPTAFPGFGGKTPAAVSACVCVHYVYACVYICSHVHIMCMLCVHGCVFMHVCVAHTRVICVPVCTRVMCVHYVCAHGYISVHTPVFVRVYMCVCWVCTCVVCVRVCTHMCVYVCVRVHRSMEDEACSLARILLFSGKFSLHRFVPYARHRAHLYLEQTNTVIPPRRELPSALWFKPRSISGHQSVCEWLPLPTSSPLDEFAL